MQPAIITHYGKIKLNLWRYLK